MLHEALDDQVSVSGKLPRTLAGLLLRPGFLTCEYAAGRIARYVPPLRLYLVSSLLLFVVLPYVADFDRLWRALEGRVEEARRRSSVAEPFVLVRLGIDPAAAPAWLRPAAGYVVRQEARLNAMPPREGARVLYGETMENVPRVVFVILPVFALFLKALFPRRRYAQHLVFALHLHAFLFLLALAALAARSTALLPVLALAAQLYLLVALKRVYAQGWPRTVVKFLALLALYAATFAAATAAVILVTVVTS
jgi:hypothetical protein